MSLVALPAMSMPEGHSVQDVQLAALVLVEKLPSVHAAHSRAVVGEPGTLTYSPGAQSTQAVQLCALVVFELLETAHGAHTRSLVVLPALCT